MLANEPIWELNDELAALRAQVSALTADRDDEFKMATEFHLKWTKASARVTELEASLSKQISGDAQTVLAGARRIAELEKELDEEFEIGSHYYSKWARDRRRGNTYRARALALAKQCHYLHRENRDLLDDANIDHREHKAEIEELRVERDAADMAAGINADDFNSTKAERDDALKEVNACHSIMEQTRLLCSRPHAMTLDAVRGIVSEHDELWAAGIAYRDAEQASDAHNVTCPQCSDGRNCARGDELYDAATIARSEFWDALGKEPK